MTSDIPIIRPNYSEGELIRQRDVVLSIRPQYSKKIMTGQKKVELRRRFPVSAPNGTLAYVYSTSPERSMIGVAVISAVKKLEVEEIWRIYSSVAFVDRSDFDKYFDDVEYGVVLELEKACPFESPIPLTDLRKRFGFIPPQSFLYAKHDLKKALEDECSVLSN